MLVWHLGVLSALRRGGLEAQAFAGSSGGAIAAVVAACVDDLQGFVSHYALHRDSRRGLEAMLPDDAHVAARGRLHISVTECRTGRNVLVSDFRSREAVLEAVWASCHIPRSFHPLDFFSWSQHSDGPGGQGKSTYPEEHGMLLSNHPKLGGGSYVDGGISANCPLVPNHETLRLSVLQAPPEPLLISRQERAWHLRLRLPGTVFVSGTPAYLSLSNLRAGVQAVVGKRRTLEHYYEAGELDGEAYIRALRADPAAGEAAGW